MLLPEDINLLNDLQQGGEGETPPAKQHDDVVGTGPQCSPVPNGGSCAGGWPPELGPVQIQIR